MSEELGRVPLHIAYHIIVLQTSLANLSGYVVYTNDSSIAISCLSASADKPNN